MTITTRQLATVIIAKTFNDGWDAFFMALPVGAVIRSNAAMAGWKAARDDAQVVDVDYN